MKEIKISDKTIERLRRKIILQESINLKTRERSSQEMVTWIKKLIEEEMECYCNR